MQKFFNKAYEAVCDDDLRDGVVSERSLLLDALHKLAAQVAEHDAVLRRMCRMCHGRPTDLPEDALFQTCIHGKGWTIQEKGDPFAAKAHFWWVAHGKPPHGGSRQGEANSISDAMDKIRKAHAELGVTP